MAGIMVNKPAKNNKWLGKSKWVEKAQRMKVVNPCE